MSVEPAAVPRGAADMAAILLDLADELAVERVPRDAIRAAWVEDNPASARARPLADPRPRGRQRGDHRRASKGSAASKQVLAALTWLERHGGAARRDGDVVVVVHPITLERLAEV